MESSASGELEKLELISAGEDCHQRIGNKLINTGF